MDLVKCVRLVNVGDWNNGLKECVESFRNISTPDHVARTLILNHITKANLFVAINQEDKVIGCFTIDAEMKLIHGGKFTLRIEDVVVHPNYRRMGVATSMLKFPRDYDQKITEIIHKIVLDCSPDLIPLYEKLGYEPTGSIEMRLKDEIYR